MNKLSSQPEIAELAKKYFDYLAKNYPVMCLSDEFHFFPRNENALLYLDKIEDLDEEKIQQDISFVKNLKRFLEKVDIRGDDLESQIDFTLLRESMFNFLREFERIKIWQVDPTLYLKILILGIEYLVTKSAFVKVDTEGALLSRLSRIPDLLREAQRNLKRTPLPSLEAGLEMTEAIIDYLKRNLFQPRRSPFGASLRGLCLRSLEDFKSFLKKKSPSKRLDENEELLEDILKNSYSCKRGLREIFDMADGEYRKTLGEMEKKAKEINPAKKWQQILSEYRIDAKNTEELLNLYRGQIKSLKRFFEEKNIISIPQTRDIAVAQTPKFMEAVRASASYACPVSDNLKEPAFFYITITGSKNSCLDDIHNEYIFLTAHETYPGHHLLDSVREGLKNPIRRRIESAFFYEGWASYAEGLVDRLGYVTEPLKKLVGLKRQAWRAIRAMLDVGARTGKLKPEDAYMMLKDLGYSARLVKLMLRHYTVTCGYQLCYTIGKFEIENLRKKFSSMGPKKFHDSLLENGQIPFDLVEKKLGAQISRE